MSTREWTDLDYAQAAIDMLPGSVEEMAVFLRAQKIKGVPSDSHSCPIAQWVRKWTGGHVSVGGSGTVYVGDYDQIRDSKVDAFIDAYDYERITL